MKDVHFNNGVRLAGNLMEKMKELDAIGLKTFALIHERIFDEMLRQLGDYSTIVEIGDETVDLVMDRLDDYDFVVPEKAAATMVERQRDVRRLTILLNELSEKFTSDVVDNVDEKKNLFSILGLIVAKIEGDDDDKLRVGKAMKDCFIESIGMDLGDLERFRMWMAAMARALLTSRLDELEDLAKEEERELEGEESIEYGALLDELGELDDHLAAYAAEHPEFEISLGNDCNESDD